MTATTKNYRLSKEPKGKKFLYTVTDEAGNVISTRSSARNYVACTANGEYYFGRLDLIGKGDHGRRISRAREFFAHPEMCYEQMIRVYVPSMREEKRKECPYEKYVEWATERYTVTLKGLTKIAYLK